MAVDCLQLVMQRVEEGERGPSVEFASFDLMALFEQAFEEKMVSPLLQTLFDTDLSASARAMVGIA